MALGRWQNAVKHVMHLACMDRTQWRAILPRWERSRQHSYTQQCWSPHSLLVFASSLLSVLGCSGQHSAIWTETSWIHTQRHSVEWLVVLEADQLPQMSMSALGKVVSPVWDSGPPALPFSVITANCGIFRASQRVLSSRWGSRLLLSLSGHASVSQAMLAPAVLLTPKIPAPFKAKTERALGIAGPQATASSSFYQMLLPRDQGRQITSSHLSSWPRL